MSKKLAEFRVSSAELIEKMSSLLAELQGDGTWKTYLDMMNRLLAEPRPASSKE